MALSNTEGFSVTEREELIEFMTSAGLASQMAEDGESENALRKFAEKHLDSHSMLLRSVAASIVQSTDAVGTFNGVAVMVGIAE